MLPHAHRLRRREEFQAAYRRGRSWAHPLVALHVLPRREGVRVGVTVSKKVGGAVVRNQVRRRLREAIRARLPLWRTGFDLVVVARTAAGTAAFDALSTAIDELAKRAKLVREPEEAIGAQFEGWNRKQKDGGRNHAPRAEPAREGHPGETNGKAT